MFNCTLELSVIFKSKRSELTGVLHPYSKLVYFDEKKTIILALKRKISINRRITKFKIIKARNFFFGCTFE
jgi:hypothetical protein